MINHPTVKQVQEDQSTEAVKSAKELIEVSLEQEWEEFKNYDFADQACQEWSDINSPPQEEIQIDQLVNFSPEQEQVFQRRFEEKYDLPDLVYQQWLKIYHPKVAEEIQEKQIQDELIAYSAQNRLNFYQNKSNCFRTLLNILISWNG